MQPAEKITCTTDSQPIEQFIVTCSPEDVFNAAEFWTTTAAVASALFTLGAVVVAYFAWQSARSNLLLLRRQIAEQRVSAKKSIAAQQQASQEAIQAQQYAATTAIDAQQRLAQAALEAQREDLAKSLAAQEKAAEASMAAQHLLAVEGRQVEYLAEYSVALRNLGDALQDEEADIRWLRSETTRTWMIWSMQLFAMDIEFRHLTGRWNSHIETSVAQLHQMWLAAQSRPETLPDIEGFKDDLIEQIGHVIGNLQVWQTVPSRREEVHKKFKDIDKVAPEATADHEPFGSDGDDPRDSAG